MSFARGSPKRLQSIHSQPSEGKAGASTFLLKAIAASQVVDELPLTTRGRCENYWVAQAEPPKKSPAFATSKVEITNSKDESSSSKEDVGSKETIEPKEEAIKSRRKKITSKDDTNNCKKVTTTGGRTGDANPCPPSALMAAALAAGAAQGRLGKAEDPLAVARARCQAAKARVHRLAERAEALERSNAALLQALPAARRRKHLEMAERRHGEAFQAFHQMQRARIGAAEAAAGADDCVASARGRHDVCVDAVQSLADRVAQLEAERAALLRARDNAGENKDKLTMAVLSWFCCHRNGSDEDQLALLSF